MVDETNSYVFWKYLRDFILGLGMDVSSPDQERVCTAAYVGAQKLGLNMPDDFEPKGIIGVTSPTVLWELYGMCTYSSYGNPSNEIRIQYNDAYKIGKILAQYKEQELATAALYLMYGRNGRKYWKPTEVESAERVLASVERARESLGR